MEWIYLDNNATTALDPHVFRAMQMEMSGPPANPSSVHSFGQKAKTVLSKARHSIASYFQVQPQELIFTSGGTESINLLIRGLFSPPYRGHLITTAIEHSAVYRTIQSLESLGVKVTYLPVDLSGAPKLEQIEEALSSETKAIVLSAANSETGVKIDIPSIAALGEKHGVPLILDATAWIGKEPFVWVPGISAIAFSGHKFHAPKGIGGAIIRPDIKLIPQLTGGNQEFQRRAGTENLASILGLAEAFRILQEDQESITEKILGLHNHLEVNLLRFIPDIFINGNGPRIVNTTNVSFAEIDGETLLIELDLAKVAVSHGSACSSGAIEPSRVLLNMGVDRKLARSAIRISLSRMNTREEIDAFIDRLQKIVKKLRSFR